MKPNLKCLEEKRRLRACLSSVLVEVTSLLSKEVGIELVSRARTVPELMRRIGHELAKSDGTESRYRFEILGNLSDLAMVCQRENPKSLLSRMPLETPCEILLWFAAYLEDLLDKPSRPLTQ